jgi:hypothetical protein
MIVDKENEGPPAGILSVRSPVLCPISARGLHRKLLGSI